ncbi:MAG: PKD domain-containing protein [Flavobacteriales bacterium]|nr:PKD domain-containing protein [Flavobacteriales bacterium]
MKNLIPAIVLSLLSSFSFGQELVIDGLLLADGQGVAEQSVFLTVASWPAEGELVASATTADDGTFNMEINEPGFSNSLLYFSSPGCPEFSNAYLQFISGDSISVVLTCDSSFNETELVYIGGASLDGALEWQFSSSVFGTPVSYLWELNDLGATYDTPDIFHTFSSPGTYNISLTCEFASGNVVSDELNICVTSGNGFDPDTLCSANFYPVLDSSVTNIGEEAVYFVNASTGADLTYFWDFGDGNTSSEQYPIHQYEVDTAEYVVCLTVSNQFCDDTQCITVEQGGLINGIIQDTNGKNPIFDAKSEGYTLVVLPINGDALSTNNKLEQTRLGVYPNPSEGEVNLSLEIDRAQSGRIIIIDQTGRQVHQETVNMVQGVNTVRTNLDLPPGLYIVRYSGSTNEAISKFVIR